MSDDAIAFRPGRPRHEQLSDWLRDGTRTRRLVAPDPLPSEAGYVQHRLYRADRVAFDLSREPDADHGTPLRGFEPVFRTGD